MVASDNKLLWWLLGLIATAGMAEAAWLGSSFVELKAEVAALNAKVDLILDDRKARYRGGADDRT